MAQDTFIKVYRKCRSNPLFQERPYDKWHAWEYLLINAQAKPKDTRLKGKTYHLKRGQLIRGRDNLAEIFGWSRGKIDRFLGTLNDTQMCTLNGTPGGTLITIVNYNKYQDKQPPNDTPDDTPDGTESRRQSKKVKESKRNIYGDFFEQIWKTYPKKKGKAQVKDKQKERLYLIGKEQIEKCIERYKQQIEKDHTAEQYIMYGSTFFNGGYEDYLDENYNEPKHKTLADTMKVF